MRAKFKPISNLYFQFIKGTAFDNELDWHDVADLFHQLGFIHLIPQHLSDKPITKDLIFKGYFETEIMRKIPKEYFKDIINEAIKYYYIKKYLK